MTTVKVGDHIWEAFVQTEHCIFRVDASCLMGTGHVMRCLTLADGLAKAGAKIEFICRRNKGDLRHMIRERGYFVHTLDQGYCGDALEGYEKWLGVPWQQDAEETRVILSRHKKKPDWLIVDHYALDEDWELVVADGCQHLMVIDDLANRKHACQLLLDQTLGRCRKDYDGLLSDRSSLLLGTTYALLNPKFYQSRDAALASRCERKAIQKVLISVGGSDQDQLTSRMLSWLVAAKLDLCFDVVIGPSAENRNALSSLTYPNNFFLHHQPKDLVVLMMEADMAVGAAGTTSWERCCLGLPTLLLVTAANQLQIAKALQHAGAVKLLAPVSDIKEQQLVSALKESVNSYGDIQKIGRRAAQLCDGRGLARAVDALLSSNCGV